MNALVDLPDAGDVLSIGRRYRSAVDRLETLDERWIGMADDAPGKWDAAEAARAVHLDRDRLLLAVFDRQTETIADIAVMAVHAFSVLDQEMRLQELPAGPLGLVLRGLADIAKTATKAAGMDFSMIGHPALPARLRACLGR